MRVIAPVPAPVPEYAEDDGHWRGSPEGNPNHGFTPYARRFYETADEYVWESVVRG